MCAAASVKERCNVELGVFAAKMYARCVPFALRGCSKVAFATSTEASVGSLEKEGGRERGRDR